jgi:hypothetical protein
MSTDPRAWLTAAKDRANAATNGPWNFNGVEDSRGRHGEFRAPQPYNGFMLVGPWVNHHDPAFVVHARTEHPAMAAALTAALDKLDELDAKHQIHGHECLCGFKSARSRDRTEHLTAEVRSAITDHLPGGQ